MKRILTILLALVFAFSLAGAFLLETPAEAEPAMIERPTIADAQVRSGLPDATDPGYQAIRAGDPFGFEFFYCYWKFDLTGIDRSEIISATFKVYSAPADLGAYWWITGIADVYAVTDDGWLENTVTWNTRPTMGLLSLDSKVLDQGRDHWYEWDVTSGVKADSGDFCSLGMKAHDGTPISLCSFVSWEGAATFTGKEAYLVLEMPEVPTPKPDISVSPPSIDFGDVTVGSSSSAETVTVSNEGDADLIIGTISITGTDAGQFLKQNDSCSGQTIPPAGSATVEVVFSPSSTGAKSATLSIPSNDPDEPTVEVSLSGTGVEAPVAPTVETATGTGTATFSSDVGSITELTAVDESSLPAEGKPDIEFAHGFFAFNIADITPGSSATVTIIFPSDIPTNTEYWKYHDPEGWVDVTSLLGDNDGDDVLTLTLTDGGLGDDDEVANGVIVDAGALGILPAPPTGVGGTAYPPDKLAILAPWIALGIILAGGITWLVLRRRRVYG